MLKMVFLFMISLRELCPVLLLLNLMNILLTEYWYIYMLTV